MCPLQEPAAARLRGGRGAVSSLWAGGWKGLEVLHVGWVGGSLRYEVVLCDFCEASWFKEMLE